MKTPYPTLPPNVYPVFPDCSTLKLSQGDISRLQPPITLGFALIEYKVQGTTFDNTIVDLKRQSKGGIGMHKQFCSTYVQLSRLYSFTGLRLLQPIDITDINNQPHSRLHDEDLRLDNISHTTSDSWEKEIMARRL